MPPSSTTLSAPPYFTRKTYHPLINTSTINVLVSYNKDIICALSLQMKLCKYPNSIFTDNFWSEQRLILINTSTPRHFRLNVIDSGHMLALSKA